MKPSSGRSGDYTYNPDDTWDNYDARELTRSPTQRSTTDESDTPYSKGAVATREAVTSAFTESNAMAALGESTPHSQSRNMLRTQHGGSKHDAYNLNILPSKPNAQCMVDEFFVGGLNVETRVKAGTLKDRMGDTYDVMLSEIPPPDKDYSNTAASTSHRNLERCMGADPRGDRKKAEIVGITNPAEPTNEHQRKGERQNTIALNERSTFFNQTGVQDSSDFDTGRDMYDGYNPKKTTGIHSLEHCWRDELARPVSKRAGSTRPEASTAHGVESRRTEVGQVYQRTPGKAIGVTARAARISLPFVGEATPRSKHLSASRGLSRHILGGTRAPDSEIDHEEKTHKAIQPVIRPVKETTDRTNPSVDSRIVTSGKVVGETSTEVSRAQAQVDMKAPTAVATTLDQCREVLDSTTSKNVQAQVDMKAPTAVTTTLEQFREVVDLTTSKNGQAQVDVKVPTAVTTTIEQFREISELYRPTASNNAEIASHIREGIDHLNQDDMELVRIADMSQKGHAAMTKEQMDHLGSDDQRLSTQNLVKEGSNRAANPQPNVSIGNADALRVTVQRVENTVSAPSQPPEETTRQGGDAVEHEHLITSAPTATGQAPITSKQHLHDQRQMAGVEQAGNLDLVACVPESVRVTGIDAARVQAERIDYPHPAPPTRSEKYDILPRVDSATIAIRPGFAAQNRYITAASDILDGQRRSAWNNNAMQNASKHRSYARPVEPNQRNTIATAGRHNTDRLEHSHMIARPNLSGTRIDATTMSKGDRSTPTRALTPNLHQPTHRWTPSVQYARRQEEETDRI